MIKRSTLSSTFALLFLVAAAVFTLAPRGSAQGPSPEVGQLRREAEKLLSEARSIVLLSFGQRALLSGTAREELLHHLEELEQLGIAALKTGVHQDGLLILEAAVRLADQMLGLEFNDSQGPSITLRRALVAVYLQDGKLANAIESLKVIERSEAAAVSPTSTILFPTERKHLLVDLLIASGQLDEATVRLTRLEDQYVTWGPSLKELRLRLAEAKLLKGDGPDAKRLFKEVLIETLDDARERYTKLMATISREKSLSPNEMKIPCWGVFCSDISVVTYLSTQLARLELASGNLKEAEEHAKRSLDWIIRMVDDPGAYWYYGNTIDAGFAEVLLQIDAEKFGKAAPARRGEVLFDRRHLAWLLLSTSSKIGADIARATSRLALPDPKAGLLAKRLQDLVREERLLNPRLTRWRPGPAGKASVEGFVRWTLGQEMGADHTDRERRLGSVLGEKERVYKELVAALPTGTSVDVFGVPKPIYLKGLQDSLASGEAMIIFRCLPKFVSAWLITKSGVSWYTHRISLSEVTDKVSRLRGPLDSWAGEPAASRGLSVDMTGRAVFDRSLAHEIFTILFGQMEHDLKGISSLILVPHGPLASLPFNVLLTGPPDIKSNPSSGSDWRAAPWIVRRFALSVLPDIASVQWLRATIRPSRAPRPFVGFANPVFSSKREPVMRVGSIGAFEKYFRGHLANLDALGSLSALPETEAELRDIATMLKARADDVIVGPSATETGIKSMSRDGRLAQYRIVAFATHGLVTGEMKGLAEPAIALSAPTIPTEEDDGLLTASEVASLILDADLVILSACNTAAEEAHGTEALSGLARAFLYAGSRSLLVSHWRVDSRAAVQLTTQTIAALSSDRRIGRAEALRLAMLRLIDDGSPEDAYPAVWAPFFLVGDSRGLP